MAKSRPEIGRHYRDLRLAVRQKGRVDYEAYIKSDAWKIVRQAYFASKLRKNCVACGATDRLHLHHRTYRRLGRENLHDLEPLCEFCHAAAHDYHRRAKRLGWRISYLKLGKRLRAIRLGRYPKQKIPEGWKRPAHWP